MPGILKWLKENSIKLVDPDREARVKEAAAHVEQELASRRKAFSLSVALESQPIFKEDIPLVTHAVYKSLVTRAWRDGVLTRSETETLRWASAVLGLSSDACRELERQIGLAKFQELLAGAIDDGILTDAEVDSLGAASASLGSNLGDLMRQYFSAESAGLLRAIFLTATSNGQVAPNEWARLLQTVQKLGLSRDELLHAIQHQAELFVEQTLAEIKADERVTAQEEALLNWLVSNLIVRPEFQFYIRQEIEGIKQFERIESGQLPSLQTEGLGRAGEIVHAEAAIEFLRTKQLRSGLRTDSFRGILTVTDDRLFFQSAELGFEVNHRRVLNIAEYSNGFHLTSNGKGTGAYRFDNGATYFTRIYHVAVRKANQTIISPATAETTRNIPRPVRQRVWQRYGGQCAECGARDYLEFDHIIPVAKGGSNSESNVQLLCRRCNNRKSDLI